MKIQVESNAAEGVSLKEIKHGGAFYIKDKNKPFMRVFNNFFYSNTVCLSTGALNTLDFGTRVVPITGTVVID